MRYYAVTNDPNELMHFGIKGMKWGVIRTDAQLGHPRHSGSRRPRSAAYKKASAKLSKSMQNGIEKIHTKWKEHNSPKAKEERFMKKALQQARNGTLKYGKLTDAQVRRVTERLALEQDARRLGNTEQPKFSKRLKISIGEGIVKGIGQGTGAYIEERFRGRGRTTADIKRDKRMAKYESNQAIQKRKAENKINAEYYEEAARRGYEPTSLQKIAADNSSRARQLMAWQERNSKEAERTKRQNEYYDNYIRTAAVNRAKTRIPDKTSNNNDNGNDNKNNNGNGQKNNNLPVSINIYTAKPASNSANNTNLVSSYRHKKKKKGRR